MLQKKMLLCFMLLNCVLIITKAQTALVVKELSGNQKEFGLNNIRSITFPDNMLKIKKQDHTESSYAISNIQSLFFSEIFTSTRNIVGDLKFQVYPNPVSDQLNCRFTAYTDSQINLLVIGADGRILLRQVYPVQAGINVITTPVGALDKGIYFLRISGPEMSETIKFTKN